MQTLQCVESAQWPVTTLSSPATPAAGAKAQGRPANRAHRCWSGGAARPWATPQLVSSGRAQGLCASQLETLSTDEAALPPPIGPTLQQAPRPLGRGPIPARPVKPTWVSAPLIMRKIKDTDSLQAMRQVLEEHQQQFNHIHISAAVLQFAKLVTGVAHSIKDRLPTSPSPSPTSRSPSPATQNGSSLQATAQLELGSPSPPLQRSETSPQPDALDLLRQLLGMVVSELDSFDLRGISNTIYSLALLKHNDGIMVESLLRAAQYRLDTGTPQNLSNIIWATVTLGHTPEREWMALYYNAIDMQIQQFQAQDISNMLWAFGRLQFAGTQYKVAPDIVRQLLQQAYPQLADFSPQELSNSVWGLARLGFAPNPAWCQAFLAVSQYRLPAMHPKELVSLVWAVSRLRMRPGDVWLNAAIQATSPWLTTLSNHQLSQLMVSLGSLGARPAAAWLSKALSCALSKVRHHTPMSLSTMVTGVAMLGGPMQAGLSMAQAEAWLEDHLSLAWEMMGGTDTSSTTTSSSHASIHHTTTTAAMHREHGSELDPQQSHSEQTQMAGSGNSRFGSHHVNGSSISDLSPTQRSGGAVLIQGSDTVLAAGQDLLQSSDRVLAPPLPQDPGQLLQGIAPGADSLLQQAAHPAVAASQQVALAATQPEQDSFLAMLDSADSDALQPAMMVCEAGLLLEEDDELQEPVYVWHPQCQFTAAEFGHLLYALATLGVRLRPPQLSHVCRTLERAPGLLESVASQGKTLGLVLWSIVRLIKLGSSGSGEHAQLQRELPQQRMLDGRIPVLPASLMARLAVVTRLLMQRRYSAAELALLLRVMAAQPEPPPERWMVAFWWRSVVLLGKRQVQPAVLASQLTSLVALGYQPHGTWWRGALQCMQAGFGDFKAEHFGAVLRRMAQLDYVPNAAWSQQCLLAIYQVWDQMTPEHWEQTFWALAKLKISVPSSWMLRYYQTSYTQLQQYTPRQLACVGWAVARLGTMPPAPWAWAYQNASATRLSQLTPAELIWCAYGVAHCVRHPMRRWVGRAVTVARSMSALGSLGPEQEQMLAIALQRILHRYRAGVVTASRRVTAASSSAENSAGIGPGVEVEGSHLKPMDSDDQVNPAWAWPHAGALVALPMTDSDTVSPSSGSPRTAEPSTTTTCHLDISTSNAQEQLASSPTNAASTLHPGAVSADELDAANRCHSSEAASVAGCTNGHQSGRQVSETVAPVQLQSDMHSSDAAASAGFDYPASQDRPLAATTTSSRSAAVRSRVAVAVMAMSGAVLDSALPGQPGPTGRGAGRTGL